MARDIAPLILRRSIGALAAREDRDCSRCRRVPVPGELVHVSESGRRLCSLCAAELSEEDRRALRTERVRPYERRVIAVQRAA
ncbi:MAG: hypothetical protein IRZ21_12715 [Thermoleophilaceae bacterium]|nr:hypothetical protein [Thermoleophilaceae bacterium]